MTLDVNLRLHIPALGDISVTGTIDEAAPAVDPIAAMQEWLSNIDAGELERAALAQMELGSGSYSSEVLAVLRRWAGGDP